MIDHLATARQIGVADFIATFAEQRAMTTEILLGRSRHAVIAGARRALYIALRQQSLSFLEIARCLDRDHSTIQKVVETQGWADRPRTQRAIHRCSECGAIKEVA